MAKANGPFDWIDFKNAEMVRWAYDYLWGKKIILHPPLDKAAFEEGLNLYKSQYGNELLLIRSMKDAWRALKQREKDKKKYKVSLTYKISCNHHSQLKTLSVGADLPINNVIEALIDNSYQNFMENKRAERNEAKEKREAAKKARQTKKMPSLESNILYKKNMEKKDQQITMLSEQYKTLMFINNELMDVTDRASNLLNKAEQKKYQQLVKELKKLNTSKDAEIVDQNEQ